MEPISNILNTSIISIGDGPGITVLQIAITLLTVLATFWLARWSERKLSRQLELHNVDAGAAQLIRRLFYIIVIAVLVFTVHDLLSIPLTAFAFITGAIAIGVG